MDPAFTWKKFQFITEVQTALIANAINLATSEAAADNKHIYSATGTGMSMQDAFYAAERIPEDMTATEAAHDFVYFTCENLRDKGQEVPKWFQRY